jgi:hypothetical protein
MSKDINSRELLKRLLTPIVVNNTSSKEERTNLLIPELRMWLDSADASSDMTLDQAFDIWNAVMVEIVEENNLQGKLSS